MFQWVIYFLTRKLSKRCGEGDCHFLMNGTHFVLEWLDALEIDITHFGGGVDLRALHKICQFLHHFKVNLCISLTPFYSLTFVLQDAKEIVCLHQKLFFNLNSCVIPYVIHGKCMSKNAPSLRIWWMDIYGPKLKLILNRVKLVLTYSNHFSLVRGVSKTWTYLHLHEILIFHLHARLKEPLP